MVSWFDKDVNIIQWEKQWPFQQMIMKQLDIHMQKNECERIHMQKNMQPHFTSMQKSTQDGLNIRSTTGKNIGENKGNAS